MQCSKCLVPSPYATVGSPGSAVNHSSRMSQQQPLERVILGELSPEKKPLPAAAAALRAIERAHRAARAATRSARQQKDGVVASPAGFPVLHDGLDLFRALSGRWVPGPWGGPDEDQNMDQPSAGGSGSGSPRAAAAAADVAAVADTAGQAAASGAGTGQATAMNDGVTQTSRQNTEDGSGAEARRGTVSASGGASKRASGTGAGSKATEMSGLASVEEAPGAQEVDRAAAAAAAEAQAAAEAEAAADAKAAAAAQAAAAAKSKAVAVAAKAAEAEAAAAAAAAETAAAAEKARLERVTMPDSSARVTGMPGGDGLSEWLAARLRPAIPKPKIPKAPATTAFLAAAAAAASTGVTTDSTVQAPANAPAASLRPCGPGASALQAAARAGVQERFLPAVAPASAAKPSLHIAAPRGREALLARGPGVGLNMVAGTGTTWSGGYGYGSSSFGAGSYGGSGYGGRAGARPTGRMGGSADSVLAYGREKGGVGNGNRTGARRWGGRDVGADPLTSLWF